MLFFIDCFVFGYQKKRFNFRGASRACAHACSSGRGVRAVTSWRRPQWRHQAYTSNAYCDGGAVLSDAASHNDSNVRHDQAHRHHHHAVVRYQIQTDVESRDLVYASRQSARTSGAAAANKNNK